MMKINIALILIFILMMFIPASITLIYGNDVLSIPMDEPITEENRLAVRENMFLGEGLLPGHGAALDWYHGMFGWGLTDHSFYPHIARQNAGIEVDWSSQFQHWGGDRNLREWHVRSMIEDFNLTPRQIIEAMEYFHNMTIQEINELVLWGRYEYQNNPEVRARGSGPERFWSNSYSLADIEALFGGDAYALWHVSPGHGVAHNGRAYTPEWILTNIEQAIYEEEIPMDQILRILVMAMGATALRDVTSEVINVLSAHDANLLSFVVEEHGISLQEFQMLIDEYDEIYGVQMHDHYHDTIRIRAGNNFIPIPADDQQPVLTDGRTLVPLRAVMEHLGFTVDWQEAESLVTLTMGVNHTIQVQIDNLIMQVNGIAVPLDVSPKLINGRTMVPVRAIAEATGFTVDWLAQERIVDITF